MNVQVSLLTGSLLTGNLLTGSRLTGSLLAGAFSRHMWDTPLSVISSSECKLLNIRSCEIKLTSLEDIFFFSTTSFLNTVHLENIQTPWLFPHFVKLQPYSKWIKIMIKNLINQHKINPIMTKQNQVITFFCIFFFVKLNITFSNSTSQKFGHTYSFKGFS